MTDGPYRIGSFSSSVDGARADEILWRVTEVGKDTPNDVVRTTLVDDVSAVVRGGLLKDS